MRHERRDFTFYPSARLDGLVQRTELLHESKVKLIESFLGRDDRLVYRSATYAAGTMGMHAEVGSSTSGAEAGDE